MLYNPFDLFAPYLPFLAILFSGIFNYYIIVKKKLSWQGILIANVVFLAFMKLFDIPVFDFLSEIVTFLLDLIFQVIEKLVDTLKEIFIGDIIDKINEIWDWLKGIFS